MLAVTCISFESVCYSSTLYIITFPFASNPLSMASSNQKVRTIRFGIETEWILRPKTPDLYFERGDVYNGLEKAVAAYNKHLDEEEKDSGYTRMVSRDGRRLHEFRSFNKYVLSIDPSVVETDEDKKLYACTLNSRFGSKTC